MNQQLFSFVIVTIILSAISSCTGAQKPEELQKSTKESGKIFPNRLCGAIKCST